MRPQVSGAGVAAAGSDGPCRVRRRDPSVPHPSIHQKRRVCGVTTCSVADAHGRGGRTTQSRHPYIPPIRRKSPCRRLRSVPVAAKTLERRISAMPSGLTAGCHRSGVSCQELRFAALRWRSDLAAGPARHACWQWVDWTACRVSPAVRSRSSNERGLRRRLDGPHTAQHGVVSWTRTPGRAPASVAVAPDWT